MGVAIEKTIRYSSTSADKVIVKIPAALVKSPVKLIHPVLVPLMSMSMGVKGLPLVSWTIPLMIQPLPRLMTPTSILPERESERVVDKNPGGGSTCSEKAPAGTASRMVIEKVPSGPVVSPLTAISTEGARSLIRSRSTWGIGLPRASATVPLMTHP